MSFDSALVSTFFPAMCSADLILDQILFHLWGKKVVERRKLFCLYVSVSSHGFVAGIGRGDHLAQCSVNEIWKVSPWFALWAGRKMCTIILLFWWPAGRTEVCDCIFQRMRECFAKSGFLITKVLSISAVNLKPFTSRNNSTSVNLKRK